MIRTILPKLTKREPGFLLLEALLAITLISVGSSAIMRTYSTSISAGIVSQQYIVASNLIEQKFWDILALDEISAAPTEGSFDSPYDMYSFSVTIEEQMPELEPTDEFSELPTDAISSGEPQKTDEEEPVYILYIIEVAVTWTYRGDEKQLIQKTAVIRKEPEEGEEFDDLEPAAADSTEAG